MSAQLDPPGDRTDVDRPDVDRTGVQPPDLRWQPSVDVDGIRYDRAVVRTEWILPGDDLGRVLCDHVGGQVRPGDLAIVSEKVAIISAGFGVPVAQVQVSPLAQRLAGWVRPTAGSRGLSIPEKMQYVLKEAGHARILVATAIAGLTRPLGIRGAFYLVAGRPARAMDGLRPPFEELLLPSLPPGVALRMARTLAAAVGTPVAIVDMNDRGGSIRAVSHPVIAKRRLRRVLADNPLGQRDTRTPIGLVRPAGLAVSRA
ncbi:MAG: hypothetical protein ACRDU8_10445 [Egibacteraceae bacterium]